MKYLWLDIETTGLDSKKDKILEVYAEVTDHELNSVEFFQTVINYGTKPPKMNERCLNMVARSWLLNVCVGGRNIFEAIERLNDFVQRNAQEENLQLAGNSVHFDRNFLIENGFDEKLISHPHLDIS